MTGSDQRTLQSLLNEGLRAHEMRLERKHIDRLAAQWPAWLARQDLRATEPQRLLVTRYLLSQIGLTVHRIALLRKGQARFTARLGVATAAVEKQGIILDYARELNASAAQLRGDARAFRRWFGPDAVQDRARVRICEAERMIVFMLQSAGRTAAMHLRNHHDQQAAWTALALEAGVESLLGWDGDARVRTSAFHALSSALKVTAPEVATHAVRDTTLAYIYRAALERRLDVWIQREALLLLSIMAADQFAHVVAERVRSRSEADDLFVRRYAVDLLGAALSRNRALEPILTDAVDDPSAFVRQGVAQSLVYASDGALIAAWPVLGLDDAIVQVRAAALLQLPNLLRGNRLFPQALNWLGLALQKERTMFGLRVALKAAEDGARAAGERQHDWNAALLPLIERLHVACPMLMVRRWAAETRERMLCHADMDTRDLAHRLAAMARQIRPGTSLRVADLPGDAAQLGRVLACVGQRDHGFALEQRGRGWRVWRGHRFGFRLWRLLHEWRHPSPDKRQAFAHTIGRVFRGTLRAPSCVLAELAQTKVPGEPLNMSTEAGWRPYLPLVDELISLLDENASDGPLRTFTAEGVTEVCAPARLTARLAARALLTHRFEKYANARNWTEGSAAHPASYARIVSELGFRIRFAPYANTLADPSVTRFFPGFVALPLPELSNRLHNYFFSAYDNTLFDLSLFVGLAIAGFVGHHVCVNFRMRRARNAIPLVVGGWGTRGKSGTERLKAAMFNALGYSVVSKTTGCEAMFLYSPPQGTLREMFLFRPYDKATIWEQYNLVRLARQLGCEVFLWECMALTPAFVRLLQRAWMRDDFATLTNTFPDHEDLQGPAGINIPQVMTEFIPRRRLLLTTEEQMRPILQRAADELQTELKGVGWLESGLIAPDILERFPYQEHPDNIALVAALGAELGIDHAYALKAMADRVVPDLGVLKTFATAHLNRRSLAFSNGMSANERYGCLGNWKRLGFDSHDPHAEPGTLISTVINNRADRVARSRVFAGVLVHDVRADFHVLIGDNLDGLRGYLRETWAIHGASLTLWPQQGGEGGAAAVLESLAREHRIVHTDAHVAARLQVMLGGIGAPAQAVKHAGNLGALTQTLSSLASAYQDEVLAFHARDVAMRQEYGVLEQRCRQAGASPDAALDQAVRDQLWRWFEQRIIVVEDYYATGDAVIAAIRDATPPGFHNRVMGMQNIKGTGLDFVYRWLAWDFCHRACEELGSCDPLLRRHGLSMMAGFQEYGLLSQDKTLSTLAAVQASEYGQQDHGRAELSVIESNFNAAMTAVLAGIAVKRSEGWKDNVLNVLEGFADASDAVRRRRQSDQIYKDLAARRISEARAVLELQGLTRRQKGGWLSSVADKLLNRWRRTALAPAPVTKTSSTKTSSTNM